MWLRARAVILLPFFGKPASVVATTSSLDVYPTSLCTTSLYSYVVYLKQYNYYIFFNVEKIYGKIRACKTCIIFPATKTKGWVFQSFMLFHIQGESGKCLLEIPVTQMVTIK